MINLLNKREEEDVRIAKIRKVVKSVTTVLLIIYLVAMSGILGWQLWFSSKEKRVSEEYQSLSWQVKNKANEEVVSRRLANRLKVVKDFLNDRGSSSRAASLLINEEASISAWVYNLAGKQSVDILGAGPWELSRYSQLMADYYNEVQFDNISFKDGKWIGKLVLQSKNNK